MLIQHRGQAENAEFLEEARERCGTKRYQAVLGPLRYIAVADDPFVAVGLLTETNIRMLGSSLRQVFPIPEDNQFDELLQALDEAVEGTREPR